MKVKGIPIPAVKRLSLYLRQLETFQQLGQSTVSSRQLGQVLGFTDAQVRKDLAYFGQFGHPGVGYRVELLIHQLRHILGTDRISNVVVVGAGNLGSALLNYKGFLAKGFRLVAAFDNDAEKVGQVIGGIPVYAMDMLKDMCRELEIRLAILAVPADQAQSVANRLAGAGVMGILNFTPVSLTAGPNLAINPVDLAVQLEQLSFQVNAMAEG